MKNILYGLVISQLLLLPLAHKWELEFNKMVAGGLVVGLLAGLLAELLSFFFALSLSLRLVLITASVTITSFAVLLFWLPRGSSGRDA